MLRLVAPLITGISFTVLLPGPASSQEPAPAMIVTAGTGNVTLQPDRAHIRFGVTTQDSTAGDAAAALNHALTRVLDTLEALGHIRDSVVRLSYSVGPMHDYSAGRRITGYEARVVVKVEVADLDEMGTLIDAALGAGATDIPEVQFESDDADEARGRALADALNHARTDAEALATAAGGALGPLLEISTDSRNYAMAFAASYEASGFSPEAFGVRGKDVVVQVDVQARWRFVERH